MDILGGLPPLDIGISGILTLVFLLVLFGKIPSPAAYKDLQADRDKWRESAEKWQLTATQLGMSMEKLLVYAETTNHAIVDIRELAQQRTGEQDPR